MATTTAHFSIDGEWFTGHVRDLVIEGRWDRAMKMLVQDIEGFGHDRAVQLLRGEMKLTGRDDLDFVEDPDSEAYRKRLDWMFAGVFVDQYGQYLRPYAVVTSWCQYDFTDTANIPLTRGSELAKARQSARGLTRNPLVYADDPRTDVARKTRVPTNQMSEQRGLPLGEEEFVLCRRVENFPHLLIDAHRLNDIENAIKALHAAGIRLRETGAHLFFDNEPKEKPAAKTLADAREAFMSDPVKAAAIEAALERTRKKSEEELRARILEQAAGDFFNLTYTNRDGERTIQIPSAPFENWALWRTNGHAFAKPWTKVSSSGMKMQGDDPYHTDWMIGAGLDLDAMHEHGSNLSDIAYDRMFRMQEEIMTFKSAILCGGDGGETVYGEVVHPKPNEEVKPGQIAVIPAANARYLKAAMTAQAVIVERGGSMAHLVTVAREKGVLIMRYEGAMKHFSVGCRVLMKPLSGEITISKETVRDAFGELD